VVRLVALLAGRAGSRSCRPPSARRRRRLEATLERGSFSMCERYSSSVVAPTARNSPRASIGLSMLPAETAPSAAPRRRSCGARR
jgi:hypothetical protein